VTAAPDVLVVGAGPTGLALATELRAHGASFRLIDRHPDRVHESRALAIQPRTLEVLFRRGLTERLVDLGRTAVQLRMHAGRRVVPLKLFDTGLRDTAYPYLLFLSQAETERILVDDLARRGVAVERGVELVDLAPDDGDVTCDLRLPDGGAERIRARYVIGCDGGRSTVRDRAGIDFPGRDYPQAFLLADLEADGLEPEVVHVWMAPAGILFFFPLGAPATWRMIAMRPPGTPEAPITLELLQRIVDAYAADPPRLRDPAWLSDFRLRRRGVTGYRSGRLFVAGDAAHVHSPAGAQGMNTGIQDAVNLGWKLAQVCAGQAPPALLDSYDAERAPVGEAVLRMTDRAFTVATSRNRLLGLLRTRVAPRLAPLALRVPLLTAFAFRSVSELGIGYRGSSLSVDGPRAPRRGPRAGDRLPDVPVVVGGEPTTLHCLVTEPTYHLLLFGAETGWGTIGEARSGLVTVHRLQGPEATFPSPVHYLVRPDGHIAYRNGGTDLTGVRAYLGRWLVTPPGARAPAAAE
jgi:2-polyprenyl-6-methoxyphenol hydroxylase-like FAD-dependent oxidoreductase